MKPTLPAALALVALLAACSSGDEELADGSLADGGLVGAEAGATAGLANEATGQAIGNAGLPPVNTPEYFNTVVGDRVFFETASHSLTPSAQTVLSEQAQWLLENPGINATIEGHADERGTRDYNLALGARRAQSVAAFLSAKGVAPARLQTVTYGKERPVQTCSNDSCWSENRRSVTVLAGGRLG